MLEHVPDPADSTPYVYWCERSTYASEDRGEPDCFARYSAATPELAIQRIRDEARALLAGLPEAESPVLGWAEGPGRVQALGALHGGLTCGLSLRHGGGWSEWVVRPRRAQSLGSADPSVPVASGVPAVPGDPAVPGGPVASGDPMVPGGPAASGDPACGRPARETPCGVCVPRPRER